ncbi:MAG: hypothetical protein M3Y13_04850 [Armatimonadota bacterium]|nr:hypothetical protein [Armatimonadota bacterium]
MRWILCSAIYMLISCVAPENAHSQGVVLLNGKIKSINYSREIIPQGYDVIIGSWENVRLDNIKSLIGNYASRSAEVELKMTSMPTRKAYRDRKMYVLLKKKTNGKLQAITWDYVDSGLCIPREMAKSYLLEGELKRLRQSNAVKWDSGCDW